MFSIVVFVQEYSCRLLEMLQSAMQTPPNLYRGAIAGRLFLHERLELSTLKSAPQARERLYHNHDNHPQYTDWSTRVHKGSSASKHLPLSHQRKGGKGAGWCGR